MVLSYTKPPNIEGTMRHSSYTQCVLKLKPISPLFSVILAENSAEKKLKLNNNWIYST